MLSSTFTSDAVATLLVPNPCILYCSVGDSDSMLCKNGDLSPLLFGPPELEPSLDVGGLEIVFSLLVDVVGVALLTLNAKFFLGDIFTTNKLFPHQLVGKILCFYIDLC